MQLIQDISHILQQARQNAYRTLAETVTNHEKCTEWHEKCTAEIFRKGGNAIGETQNAETRHDAAFVNG